MVRPNDPIPFIANFMLRNKHTMKTLDDYVKIQVENERISERMNEVEIEDMEEGEEVEENDIIEGMENPDNIIA
jgi:hypothetical protein